MRTKTCSKYSHFFNFKFNLDLRTKSKQSSILSFCQPSHGKNLTFLKPTAFSKKTKDPNAGLMKLFEGIINPYACPPKEYADETVVYLITCSNGNKQVRV